MAKVTVLLPATQETQIKAKTSGFGCQAQAWMLWTFGSEQEKESSFCLSNTSRKASKYKLHEDSDHVCLIYFLKRILFI